MTQHTATAAGLAAARDRAHAIALAITAYAAYATAGVHATAVYDMQAETWSVRLNIGPRPRGGRGNAPHWFDLVMPAAGAAPPLFHRDRFVGGLNLIGPATEPAGVAIAMLARVAHVLATDTTAAAE